MNIVTLPVFDPGSPTLLQVYGTRGENGSQPEETGTCRTGHTIINNQLPNQKDKPNAPRFGGGGYGKVRLNKTLIRPRAGVHLLLTSMV